MLSCNQRIFVISIVILWMIERSPMIFEIGEHFSPMPNEMLTFGYTFNVWFGFCAFSPNSTLLLFFAEDLFSPSNCMLKHGNQFRFGAGFIVFILYWNHNCGRCLSNWRLNTKSYGCSSSRSLQFQFSSNMCCMFLFSFVLIRFSILLVVQTTQNWYFFQAMNAISELHLIIALIYISYIHEKNINYKLWRGMEIKVHLLCDF